MWWRSIPARYLHFLTRLILAIRMLRDIPVFLPPQSNQILWQILHTIIGTLMLGLVQSGLMSTIVCLLVVAFRATISPTGARFKLEIILRRHIQVEHNLSTAQ